MFIVKHKERKEPHNIGSHREKMASRRKLQRERTPGFIPVYTKKQLEALKEENKRRDAVNVEAHTKL